MSRPDAVVVTAMPQEAAAFTALAEHPVPAADGVAPVLVHLGGVEIALVTSGVGLVNAALAATLALRETGAEVLISAGSAGGLAGVDLGDVVVASSTRYTTADATAFDYAIGQVPGMPAGYDGDRTLLAAAASHGTEQVVRVGEIVSGDVFVDQARTEVVRATFPQALAVDMETTALAQVAHLLGARFVSVRGISDLCGPADFTAHVDDAADRSAQVVLALLRGADDLRV